MGAPFSPDVVISLANVLVFVVIQTIFFWLIASREVDRVVEGKARILRHLRDRLVASGFREEVLALDAQLVRTHRALEPVAAPLAAARRRANWDLTVLYIGPFLAVAAVLLLYVVGWIVYRGHRFGGAHAVGLALIPFGYVFEVMFFLLVVNNWVMIGDQEMLQRVSGWRT